MIKKQNNILHNQAVATLSYSFDHTKPRDAVWKPHVVESHDCGQQLDCCVFTYEICLIHFANCQQKAFEQVLEFCFPISFPLMVSFCETRICCKLPFKAPRRR